MMTRRAILAGLLATAAGAAPALAQDAATRSVQRQLEAQGFTVLEIRRTLLGRVRVVARRGNLMREIVFDPRNGAILRDYTSGDGSVEPQFSYQGDDGDGAGPGGDDDDDDDDDDADDDDDDDDDDDADDDDDDDDDDDGGDDDGGDDDDDD